MLDRFDFVAPGLDAGAPTLRTPVVDLEHLPAVPEGGSPGSGMMLPRV